MSDDGHWTYADFLNGLRDELRACFPGEAERRNYALLQAAAILASSFRFSHAVEAAEEMLAEIERGDGA